MKSALGILHQEALGIRIYRSEHDKRLVVATSNSTDSRGFLLANEYESSIGSGIRRISHRKALHVALAVRLKDSYVQFGIAKSRILLK